jgi:hypothetical protein
MLNLLMEQDTEGTDIKMLRNNLDEIIAKIEKRIDEFITEDRKRPYAEQDEVIAAIEDLKKEILK